MYDTNRWHDLTQITEMSWGEQFRAYVVTVSGTVFSFVSNLVMVVIFLVFILLGKPYFGYKLRKALSPGQAGKVDRILSSIAVQIGRYLSVQVLISLKPSCISAVSLSAGSPVDFDLPLLSWNTMNG